MEAPQLLRVGYPVRLCELKAEALKNAWGRVEALPSEPGGRCAVRVVYPAGARAAYAAPIALKPSNLHRLSVGSETDWYYAYPLREFVEEEATSASLQLSKEAAGGDARVTPVLCSSPAVGAVLSRLRSVARVAEEALAYLDCGTQSASTPGDVTGFLLEEYGQLTEAQKVKVGAVSAMPSKPPEDLPREGLLETLALQYAAQHAMVLFNAAKVESAAMRHQAALSDFQKGALLPKGACCSAC